VLEILNYVMRWGATQILLGLEGHGCCCNAILTTLLLVDLFRRLSVCRQDLLPRTCVCRCKKAAALT
jgi:hypothetical protein